MSWYANIEDFAGPVATVAAASAAAFVTISIQRQNHRLARERLKLDLFDKRYEVFAATRDLLLLLQRAPDIDEPTVRQDLDRIYAKMAEAPLVCGPTAKAFCERVRAADQTWRAARGQASVARHLAPGPEKVDAVLAPSRANLVINELLELVVPAFSEDLYVGLGGVK